MFDLNIDHYTKEEIEDLFDLKTNTYTNNDVEKNLEQLKRKIEMNKKIESQVKHNTLNFLLTAKELLVNSSPGLLSSHVIEQGENFLIQKEIQRPQDVGYSDAPFYRGVLNPLQRRVKDVVVNIDSSFRDDQKSLTSDFVITLPDLLKNVISLEVASISAVVGFLDISDKLQNNYFHYQVGSGAIQKHVIADGLYQGSNKILDNNVVPSVFTLTDNSQRVQGDTNHHLTSPLTINNSSGASDLTLYFNKLPNNDDDNLPNLRQRAGWTVFGYHEETLVIPAGQSYTFKYLPSIETSQYMFLVLDDFQNNFNQTIINPSAQHLQSNNIVSKIDCANAVNNNLLKNTMSQSVFSPERKYFGPVDLQKFKIQLVDEFGRVVDLQGLDFSFSILLKTQYDM